MRLGLGSCRAKFDFCNKAMRCDTWIAAVEFPICNTMVRLAFSHRADRSQTPEFVVIFDEDADESNPKAQVDSSTKSQKPIVVPRCLVIVKVFF
jgi:hypothetical protein